MATPSIITVAITGSVSQKTDNQAVPITVNEQIEAAQAAFEAGAALAHCHVRHDDGTPTSDPERFDIMRRGVLGLMNDRAAGTVPRLEQIACHFGLTVDHHGLAAGQTGQVERVVALCPEYDRRPATVAEARELLSLPPA